MNIYWVICLAVIWISTTIGAMILNIGEVYIAAFFATIVWAIIMGVIHDMDTKKTY